MLTPEIINLWKKLWEYNRLNHTVEKSDIIFVLGSHDIRVVERAVELFKLWFGNKILFSGWMWRLTNDNTYFSNTTEADVFASKAIELWVPKDSIIIENQSTNTGENIRFGYNLIKHMLIQKMILVQKPYMERRTYATFMKQWPWDTLSVFVTSPQISFEEYPTLNIPFEEIIHIMVGDTERIIKYPALWFQIEQEIPENIVSTYQRLIELWFSKYLIQ